MEKWSFIQYNLYIFYSNLRRSNFQNEVLMDQEIVSDREIALT